MPTTLERPSFRLLERDVLAFYGETETARAYLNRFDPGPEPEPGPQCSHVDTWERSLRGRRRGKETVRTECKSESIKDGLCGQHQPEVGCDEPECTLNVSWYSREAGKTKCYNHQVHVEPVRCTLCKSAVMDGMDQCAGHVMLATLPDGLAYLELFVPGHSGQLTTTTSRGMWGGSSYNSDTETPGGADQMIRVYPDGTLEVRNISRKTGTVTLQTGKGRRGAYGLDSFNWEVMLDRATVMEVFGPPVVRGVQLKLKLPKAPAKKRKRGGSEANVRAATIKAGNCEWCNKNVGFTTLVHKHHHEEHAYEKCNGCGWRRKPGADAAPVAEEAEEAELQLVA